MRPVSRGPGRSAFWKGTHVADLVIEGLRAEIDGKEILKGIDLELSKGEVHAVMGPNGSGKSTLSYVLMGHPSYEVTGGSVTFKGVDPPELEPEERPRPGHFPASPSPAALPPGPGPARLARAVNAPTQAGAQAADDGIKLTPGPGHIGTQDGGLVGQPGGGAVQHVGQGLAADGGMVLHAGLLMRVRLHRSGWAGTRLSGPSRGQ